MPRCAAITRAGTPCERIVRSPDRFCFAHDPDESERRSRNAATGGRSKASAEVRKLKAEIRTLIADVREGSVDRNDAGTMIAGYRALRDYIELERRVVETDELMARLAQLEEAASAEGARWGT